jgi:hypothetical protein
MINNDTICKSFKRLLETKYKAILQPTEQKLKKKWNKLTPLMQYTTQF